MFVVKGAVWIFIEQGASFLIRFDIEFSVVDNIGNVLSDLLKLRITVSVGVYVLQRPNLIIKHILISADFGDQWHGGLLVILQLHVSNFQDLAKTARADQFLKYVSTLNDFVLKL